MKKSALIIIAYFANNLTGFAQTDNPGMDMELYSTIAGYAFLIFVLVLFSLLIYYSHRDFAEPVKITMRQALPAVSGKFSAEVFASMNRIYYMVVVLAILYLFLVILIMFLSL
jgi:hypothetical protein